ncbi:MAG: ABC transporter substrate-binding protein [Caulobacterales bacterium]
MKKAARFLAMFVAFALMSGAAHAERARPMRVMSMQLCADQLLLMLLPPERIASVSWLARDPNGSVMAEAARRVPVNHGQAEEVLRDRPDLILSGTFDTPALRAMLRRLGYQLIEVPEADDFDAIRRVTRQVGAAVGEEARAEGLIAQMDADLAKLRSLDAEWRPRVVAWEGDGSTLGRGTLLNSVIEAAGAQNIAAEMGAAPYGAFDIEALIVSRPDILIEAHALSGLSDRRMDVARHPFVRRYYENRRIAVPQAQYSCGTPLAARAALQLRTGIDLIEAQTRRAPPYQIARSR